jgi:hypothetical protein
LSLLIFRIVVAVAALIGVRYYVTRARSRGLDRLIVLALLGGLGAALIHPPITQWVAERFGIGRGVDLSFYVGFVLLFFLVGILRLRLRELERSLTVVVRRLALLEARAPDRTSDDDRMLHAASQPDPNLRSE